MFKKDEYALLEGIKMWLVLFVLLLVVELLTVNLVCIWFAIGALAAGLVSYFIDNMMIQVLIFIIISIIVLLLTKPFVEKLRKGKVVPTNLDRVIGKIGIVTEEITKLEPGEVKVDGKRWSALSNGKIEVGSKVEILSIDGVKLHVKEIEEKEEN